MREVAIIGVGMTKFGKHEETLLEMFNDATEEALLDSGTSPKEIEAIFFGNCLGGFEEGQMNISPFGASVLGLKDIPTTRFECACATATVAIRYASLAVASGVHDTVLAGGTEKTLVMGTSFATRTFAMASDSRYEGFSGITFPGAFAMMAMLYSQQYGIPLKTLKERMAMIAVKNHRNGVKNPKAHFRKEITIDDVYNSIMVADPLQLYDCCPFTDGASAIIITTLDRAREICSKPVVIAGTGLGSAGSLLDQKDLPRLRAREVAAKEAYDQAGLTPADIDVCELHDCFTIAEIIATEGLGFFDHGKGSEAVDRGETDIGGKIPINPSGGLKARGHPIGATGAAQVYVIVKELREEAGDFQVDGARIGMIDTLGGDFSVVCNLILKRGW